MIGIFAVGDLVTVFGHEGVIAAINTDLGMAHICFDDDFPSGWLLPHVIQISDRRTIH